VARVVEGERAVAVHLHRPAVFRAYFLGGEAAAVGRAEPTDGLELDCPCSSGLTAARAASGRSCLARIRSSDPGAAALRVGPVLGQDGRKEELETVEQLEKRVGAAARLLDEARREEGEEEGVTETRLGRLARAAVQFAFLGGSLARPVRIDLTCQRSSFVLYNNARMRRLLAAFEQRVLAGAYPGLPAAKTIQFELLAEPEEWQLMFNYLLVADDVISECAASLSLHKLVQLVCGLASTYSRYYNRVKTLKDPLPGLVPLVHARVFLVREVNRVCERLLRLLGCQPLENM
jgi:arginyl-tRNA synthetase